MSPAADGDILAVDVGTSGLRLGVFDPSLEPKGEARRAYEPRSYEGGKADIDPETWWSAFRGACGDVRHLLGGVAVVALSVTTPGLTPMDADGRALGPAILFYDGRSRPQSAAIRRLVGDDRFLEEACNLPVSGGSSLSSILWIREHEPDVWAATAKFGHTNTYMVKRLTGAWAIDPSTVSITGLYATRRHDLTWNHGILDLAGIDEERLPRLMQSHDVAGTVLPGVAAELGLPRDVAVLCGANDAVLAALSGGSASRGDVSISCGTTDIATVCIDRPLASPTFNVRCHVLPDRWLTFFVLNTGGEALDWFHRELCRELDDAAFHGAYVPAVLASLLTDDRATEREARLPAWIPYLSGSRYSLDRLTAAFSGLTLETTRDDLLLGLLRGNMAYLGDHLAEVGRLVPLNRKAGISGSGAASPGMLEARRRWTGDFAYVYHEQSSMLGAAMLGRMHLAGRVPEAGAPLP